ncbi:MAG: hypothetical protein Q8L86_11120 [Vicinamibacterales bacterium]|nr:hypothetical protein [Vicinamibacterales bacterium]
MVWFYERQGAFIRCEARPAPDGSGYELEVTHPDGTERLERFEDSESLMRRQHEIETTFSTEGWTGPHGRII